MSSQVSFLYIALIKTASEVIGVQQTLLRDIFKERVVNKAYEIINCPSHPLHKEFAVLPSGRGYRAIGCGQIQLLIGLKLFNIVII